MERITISLDDQLCKQFDALIASRGVTSRSEAMRDLLRRELETERAGADPDSWCVANLSYVYDHHVRNLATRLAESQHQHHDMVVSTMHVHLDHENCLESAVLKGPTAAVQAFALALKAERGVRHVALNVITVAQDDQHRRNGYKHHHAGHNHLIPRS